MVDTRKLVWIAQAAAILLVTGMFKLPALIPGLEFQLSAPFAVVIAAVFGFKIYFIAGLIAAALSLLLGTSNIFNIGIALVFRLAVGAWFAGWGRTNLSVLTAAAVGSLIARAVMAFILDVPFIPLAISVLPGMIISGIVALLLYRAWQRVPLMMPQGLDKVR